MASLDLKIKLFNKGFYNFQAKANIDLLNN